METLSFPPIPSMGTAKSFRTEMREGCDSLLLQDLMRMSCRFSSSLDWGRFGVVLAQFQGHFPAISRTIYELLDEDEKTEFVKWFLLRWGDINVLSQQELDQYDEKWAKFNTHKWHLRRMLGGRRIVVDLREKYGFLFIYDGDCKTLRDGAWILCDFLHNQYAFKNVGPRPGDVIVDAGAYLGETALLFSSLLRGKCYTHAFEVSPPNYETMLANLHINGLKNVYPNRLALSEKTGDEVTFSHAGGATRLDGGSERMGIQERTYTVPTVSLDDYVEKHSLDKVDFIKMDIEGAEMQALRGAAETIRKYTPRLAISIYHLPSDPYEIPKFIRGISPQYHFHFNWYAKRRGVDAILYAALEERERATKKEAVLTSDDARLDEVVCRSLFAVTALKADLVARREDQLGKLRKRIKELRGSKAYKLGYFLGWPYRVLRSIGNKTCKCYNTCISVLDRMFSPLRRTTAKMLVSVRTACLAVVSLTQTRVQRSVSRRIGFLTVEYPHQGLSGTGGLGMTTKNVADYFNRSQSPIAVEVLLTHHAPTPEIQNVHRTTVVVAPDGRHLTPIPSIRYMQLLHKRHPDLLITVEYAPAYFRTLCYLPHTPAVIWIHDPRPLDELERIATVPLELTATGKHDLTDMMRGLNTRRSSMRQLITWSRFCRRTLLFATTAQSLVPLARNLYGLPALEPFFLPIPVDVPSLNPEAVSPHPSVCFLGRLDPIKRPWIFFELAKRFPHVEFLVAGVTHFPEIMNPIIHRYTNIPNLKFLGLVTGAEKAALLNRVWALVNTSVHEALPVSFLESLAHGKPVISCQNPDNIVGRFGVHTGELLGEGFDDRTVETFAEALERILTMGDARIELGVRARQFIHDYYSYTRFERELAKLMEHAGCATDIRQPCAS